jgi:hypothetical protein
MIRPIRVDHTEFFEVAIKTLQYSPFGETLDTGFALFGLEPLVKVKILEKVLLVNRSFRFEFFKMLQIGFTTCNFQSILKSVIQI